MIIDMGEIVFLICLGLCIGFAISVYLDHSNRIMIKKELALQKQQLKKYKFEPKLGPINCRCVVPEPKKPTSNEVTKNNELSVGELIDRLQVIKDKTKPVVVTVSYNNCEHMQGLWTVDDNTFDVWLRGVKR